MPDQITIHDYQVPDVTFEEADTIARNVFGDSMISPDFADKIRLILEDDRERVADLQDPWVEVPEGATIPEGVMIRRVLLLTERASEWIAFEQVVAEGAPSLSASRISSGWHRSRRAVSGSSRRWLRRWV